MPGYSLDRSPLHLLYRASQCAELAFGVWVANGLTPRQLAVLATIAEHEGSNQIALTARTGIDRSTTTDIVRRLARRGLVQRRRSRVDARAYVLKVTKEGRRVLGAVEPLAAGVDAGVLKTLPDARRKAFVGCLQTIVRSLEPMHGAASRRPRSAPSILRWEVV